MNPTRALLVLALAACDGDPEAIDPDAIHIAPMPIAAPLQINQAGQVDGDLTVFTAEALTVASGDDYPASLDLEFAYLICGGSYGVGTLEITGLGSSDPAVVSDEGAIVGPGTATVSVLGTLDINEMPCLDRPEVRIDVPVTVHEVSGLHLITPSWCPDADEPVVLAGHSLELFGVQPLDAAGAPFGPSNLEHGRQAPVDVSSDVTLGFAGEERAVDTVVAAEPGTIHVIGAGGEERTVDVVAPEALTEVEWVFALAGFAGTPVTVEDGGSYGASGWGRTTNALLVHSDSAAVDGAPLCHAAAPMAEISAGPPEVCVTAEGLDVDSVVPAGLTGPTAVRIVGDGTCQVTARLGAIETSASFSFVRTDGLLNAFDL